MICLINMINLINDNFLNGEGFRAAADFTEAA